MGPDASDEAIRWAVEKRDIVADWRDETADERDVLADARDVIADAREADADAREAELDGVQRDPGAGSESFGIAVEPWPGAEARETDRRSRARAREERAAAGLRRLEVKQERDAAAQRRVAEGHPTLLALAFAQIADQLYDAPTYDEMLTRIAAAAVATVAGGESASVTLSEDGSYRTVGATDQRATSTDQEQYDANEGPALDAFGVALVDAPTFPDPRWPVLGERPRAHGVESSVAYRLRTVRRDDPAHPIGALSIYGTAPEAFDATAVEIGSILAAHASLAARAVEERAGLESLGRQLQEALLSRDVIGQAKGILMERLKVTPDEAFEILKRSSKRLNVKLRDVAGRVAQTGEVNRDDLGS